MTVGLDEISDCHCHIGTSCTLERGIDVAAKLSRGDFEVNASLCTSYALMSTNHLDVDIVRAMASRAPRGVIVPFFGIHPWYSHLFATVEYGAEETEQQYKRRHYASVLYPAPSPELLEVLPVPVQLVEHLDKLRRLRGEFALEGSSGGAGAGAGIGEIGLDKPFRIPVNGFFGNVECPIAEDNPNKLSNCRVTMDHQVSVLSGQLQLAQDLSLPVSLHCVKAHGLLYDTVNKFALPSTVLHSYSGSIDQAKLWLKKGSAEQGVFFSVSNWINGAEAKANMFRLLMGVLSDSNVLLETDLSIDRSLAECHEHLGAIFEKVCEARGWKIEEGRAILRGNWQKCLASGTGELILQRD